MGRPHCAMARTDHSPRYSPRYSPRESQGDRNSLPRTAGGIPLRLVAMLREPSLPYQYLHTA